MKTSTNTKGEWRRILRGYLEEGDSLVTLPESPLEAVLYETVRLFHRLRVVMEELHGQGELSSGKAGVLRGLERHGPQTVPQMARARPVSRQYIQTLVNPLLKEGFVELLANPAHKKSPLVHLTTKGRKFVKAMDRRESRALESLNVKLKKKQLLAAVEVLTTLRRSFESPEWKLLLESMK